MLHRRRLRAAPAERVSAHGGVGQIWFERLMHSAEGAGGCHFIDHAILPPGVSIGRHKHTEDEEEFYLILSGRGQMWQDGEAFEVEAGELVRNRPGGAHGLENIGDVPLEIFVFEVGVPR